MRIRRIICLILLISMACLAGCSKKEDKKKTAVVKEFEALTDIQDGRPNIYLITKATNNNYWNVVVECMKKSAIEQNCNMYFSGSEIEAEWETQVELLNKAVEAKADAIIIAPDDSSLMAEPIEKVYEKGIPVVLIDTTITKDNYDVCFMTDNLYAGRQAAAEMLYQLEKSGLSREEKVTIGIQVGSGSSQTISERLAGFTKYWTSNAPATWKIADEVKVNNGDIELATEYAYAFMDEDSTIKGFFGCNNGSTVGFAKAISEKNRTDIVLVGFDYSEEMAKLISNPNFYAATMLQRQDRMASLGVKAALDCLKGIKSDIKFVDTGVVVVNDETVNNEEIQSVINLN